MDIEKTIKANKIFLTIQTIAFVVDIILIPTRSRKL